MLKPAANSTIRRLVEQAASSKQLRVALVSGLLGRGRIASAEYDRNANTKALRQLISSGLDAGGEGESESYLIDHFCSLSHRTLTTEKHGQATAAVDDADAHARQLQASRVWALDQLLMLSRSSLQRSKARITSSRKASRAAEEESAPPAKEEQVSLPYRTIRFFFANAFFEFPAGAQPTEVQQLFGACPALPLCVAARRACAERFFSLLGECLNCLSVAGSAAGVHTSEAELELLKTISSWCAIITNP